MGVEYALSLADTASKTVEVASGGLKGPTMMRGRL